MEQPSPSRLGLQPSFGFGDRLGSATPGHADALRTVGGPIRGVFAQQSIREMTRTRRTPGEVIAAATDALAADGWQAPWGADADHLKTPEDVQATADAGFTFFTIDPSDDVDPDADALSDAEAAQRVAAMGDAVAWTAIYAGKTVELDGMASLELPVGDVHRAAVKYGRAIDRAVAMAREIGRVMAGRDCEIELSVDETPHPTTPAEHYVIADRCREQGVRLVSLAPRFVGDFEKGVDFRGDLVHLRDTLARHAAIARTLGPYKLSLHSGSDKLSMYRILAEATAGRFHVKTAGTSYLEALRVAARADAALFRRIVDFSRGRYETDRATYHVSATLAAVPTPAAIDSTEQLEKTYLGLWADQPAETGLSDPGRQILHTTFGSVLTDPKLGAELHQCLAEHTALHRSLLAEHFTHHLTALRAGM